MPVFVMPGTSHYPPIDSPLAFVSTVKAIALGWVAEMRRDALQRGRNSTDISPRHGNILDSGAD